jgi:hypothetical protein
MSGFFIIIMPKSRRQIYRERLAGMNTHVKFIEKTLNFFVDPLERAGKIEELEFIALSLGFLQELKGFIRHMQTVIDGSYYEMEGYYYDDSTSGTEPPRD